MNGDERAHEQLRAAARTVASPRLRVVFEAAASADAPDALEHALERVDAAHRRGR